MFKMQKTISWILLLAILIGLLPMQVLAENSKSKLIPDGCTFEFSKTSDWDSGFNGQIKITNKSQKAIENWAISFEFEHEISNFWNTELIKRDENTYIIKNCGWNADIQPGCTIDIGFSGNPGNVTSSPKNYILLNEKVTCIQSEYVVDFNISSDWKEAFNGEIVITNISDQTIEDWSLEFDFDKNISSFWTADIANHEGNHYSIVNKGYNANIAPGASVSLGFRGEPGDVTCSPENFILQKYQIANPHQKVLSYIMANPEDDYDGDGLLNSFEIDAYGCTNPMKADSDDDGISDGDEDHDLDGLSNFNEQKNGTNPIDKDTDKDGLSDGFEINTYQTLPNKYDTDYDGLNDGDEYKLGTNPNNPDSDNDGIIDSQEIYEQSMTETFISADKPEITSVTVNFGTNENIERTTTITNTYGIDPFSIKWTARS